MKKGEYNLAELWNMIKLANIHITEIQEGEKGTERIFEQMLAENFPNLVKMLESTLQGTQ